MRQMIAAVAGAAITAAAALGAPLPARAIGAFDASDIIVTPTYVEFRIANLDRTTDGDNGGYDGAVIWAAISCLDAPDGADGVDGDGHWLVSPSVSDGSVQYNNGDVVQFTPGVSSQHPVLWDGTPYSLCYARIYTNAGLNDYQSRGSFAIPVGTPPLPSPTAREDCRKDGWRTYGRFKNQGDCVRYISTGK